MIARPMRTVTYCRMSGAKQEASIPRQRDEIKAYATKHGYKIVRDYADEAQSGDAQDRAAFNRLIGDAERKGDFDVVLCWHMNRFSRFDDITQKYFFYRLREAGVRLVTVNQGEIDFDDMGQYLSSTIDTINSNKFLKDLGRVVCSGFVRSAQHGRRSAKPPFGYRKTGKGTDDIGKMEIDPAQAAIVREMFDAVINRDVAFRTLAAELMTRKVPSPCGKSGWLVGTVKYILRNPAYIGTKVYGKNPQGKHFRIIAGEVVAVPRGQTARGTQAVSDCIVTKDAYPAILDPATFKAVQKILDAKKGAKRTRRNSYLLSGLIWCAVCGGRCTGYSGNNGFSYYSCASRRYGGAANMDPGCRYLPRAERVEALVRTYIETEFLTDDRIREFSDWQRKHLGEIRGTAASKSKALAKRLEALKTKLGKLESRLADAPADMLDALYRQIRSAKADADATQMELDGLESLTAKTDATARETAKDNVARLTKLREHLLAAPPDVARRAIEQIVEAVVVHSKPSTGRGGRELEKLEVTFRKDILSNEQLVLDSCPFPNTVFKAILKA